MPFTPRLYCPFGHRRDIRLLRIKSERDGKSIEVDLEVFKLDSNVQYTALSYVWGNQSSPSWIACNGHSVPITRNLWEVLSCLQEQNFHGLLWIDAICINQQDNKEKGIQVNIMRDIYKRAADVIIWLGQQE
ncbi:heterokaryon incompatibility protein-domain-containing protein, partial [Phaeosphaeriaceae sp. PMI808]